MLIIILLNTLFWGDKYNWTPISCAGLLFYNICMYVQGKKIKLVLSVKCLKTSVESFIFIAINFMADWVPDVEWPFNFVSLKRKEKKKIQLGITLDLIKGVALNFY